MASRDGGLDHGDLVGELIGGGSVLLAAQVHALTRALVSDKRFKESVKARGHVVCAASEESAALSSDHPPPCRCQEVYIFLDILGSS